MSTQFASGSAAATATSVGADDDDESQMDSREYWRRKFEELRDLQNFSYLTSTTATSSAPDYVFTGPIDDVLNSVAEWLHSLERRSEHPSSS